MTDTQIPVFDASSEFHQNLGLLKVAETAMRKHGDMVMIRANEARQMLLLTGTDSIRFWKNNQGKFQTELGDIATNAGLTRILIGDALEQPENAAIWDATRGALAQLNTNWDAWAHIALVDASNALVADLAASGGAALDLRPIASLWSVRALCPVLFGRSLPNEEMVRGLMQIEQFYFAMSTKSETETATPETLEEFQIARGFLDRAVEAGLTNMSAGDGTAIALLDAVLPDDLPHQTRVALLRPTLGRLLLEKLNIDGLGLLWALRQLAQDPELVDEMAAELQGKDIYDLPDDETPLCFSVIREVQRMYPELPFIYRINSMPMDLFGKEIPAETTILFAPWLVHRDKRYWENPDHFDGRRFLQPLSDASSYLPFGIGPRVRARTKFLQHQLSVAVRAVVSEYHFDLAPDCKPGNLRAILRSTLAPRGAVTACFTPRAEASSADHSEADRNCMVR